MCPIFVIKFSGVSDLQGVKVPDFPLTLLVIVTTVLRYRAACDTRNVIVECWICTVMTHAEKKQVGARPDGCYDMRPSWIITYYHKNKAFPLAKCIRWYVQNGLLIIWSWFDINRSTFDEDVHKNDFYFRSQWPWPLDRKFDPLVTLV